jgi:HK97 family phage major capsid protein
MAGGATMTPSAKAEHFAAVVAAALGGNPLHPALLPKAGTGNEAVGSEGGFAVVSEVAAGIFARAVEESVFARIGARVEEMKSDEKTIVALDDDDETGDAEAGLTSAWTGETADAGTPQVMAIRAVTLKAHKLMVLAAVSNELADDAEGLMVEYEGAIARAVGKKFDRAILSGSGAGQPQGLLSAAATIEVAKTVNSDPGTANTFTWNHAVGMWSRLSPGSHERAYWLMHPTVLPQALSMSVRVVNAAANDYVGGFQPLGGFTAGGPTGYMLLGRPVVITGRMKALSSRGDVLLVDPSQLAIGIRRGITIDRSPHVYFTSDRLAIRGKFRGDAIALWDVARTMQEGSVTVSPYVVLAAR